MFQIDLKSRKPIYEQIIDNYKQLITCGALKADDKVPSVREMAKVLTVNPNTIQKAYRELENQGYIYTVIGQGSFIASKHMESNQKEIDALYKTLKTVVRELVYLGEDKNKIIFVIQEDS